MVRQAQLSHTTRRKSAVWKNFDYVQVPGASAMAACKRCGSMYQASSKKHGTSQLRRHAGSSCCAKRAAERAAAAPADGDDDDDLDEEEIAKWVEELLIGPGYDAGVFSKEEQLDNATTTDSPFTHGRQVDGAGGEVAAAGDHDRRSPNCMPDTHLPQAQSSSSMRFFQKKRERSAYVASHQEETPEKDHSSCGNTDWAPSVDNSFIYADFTFRDAYN